MQQWQVGPVPEYIYSNAPHQPNDMHQQHPYQPDMSRRDPHPQFQYGAPPHQSPAPQHHQPTPVQPPMSVPQPPQQPPQVQPQHQQHHQQHHQQQQQQQHQPQPQHAPQPQPQTNRNRKRPAPAPAPVQQQPPPVVTSAPSMPSAPAAPASTTPIPPPVAPPVAAAAPPAPAPATEDANAQAPQPPPAKKSRTNTPWTPAEELRLKQMRDAGNSWAEIAKTFPTRTEGSVKKHWYKDMHYAEFAEDESQALLNAIKEYENNKWKVIGQKVGKPAKACEQYAKEHFPDLWAKPTTR
ncbi:hypothetical protein CCHL11_08038 [Colletotrichum chlorophyti]|uniref:Uncharacterized protein n=1 Tax=Colletotrichum chlorophyti TaxID=708187 RepID=A0A1Q8RMH0_9PEZI|nr:hypothetical protein CCHL11_08038 [Colletotrichum chlorophyti]